MLLAAAGYVSYQPWALLIGRNQQFLRLAFGHHAAAYGLGERRVLMYADDLADPRRRDGELLCDRRYGFPWGSLLSGLLEPRYGLMAGS